MVRESYLTTMRYLNFLIPLVGLLFLGGLYTYRTYWSPNLIGHWHAGDPEEGNLMFYDFYEDGLAHATLGVKGYGWAGDYTTLGRQIIWGGECIGAYDYRYVPVNNDRLKAINLHDERGKTTYFERHHNCTDYSHWQLGIKHPINLPELQSPANGQAYPESQLTIDSYLFQRDGATLYGLSNQVFTELRSKEVANWIVGYFIKIPEGKRSRLTVTLAADKASSATDYEEATRLLNRTADSLNVQLTLQRLYVTEGKLLTVPAN